MPGATTAPLDQLLEPSACWETYRRTNTKPLRRIFSLPFWPSRWPDLRQVTRHAAIHSSDIPATIGDCIRALAPGANTACTQPLHLGVPKATPPLNSGVCVCVCMCVYVCVIYINLTLNLFYTIPVVNYLCLHSPFTISGRHQIRCLPCYTPIILPHRIQILDLISSRRPRMYPLDLTPPGREQYHHRPTRQLWF